MLNAADPDRALIDRGFWNWLLPGGLTLLGLLIVGAYAKFVVGYLRRRRTGKELLARLS